MKEFYLLSLIWLGFAFTVKIPDGTKQILYAHHRMLRVEEQDSLLQMGIPTSVAWLKFAALAEGARLATGELWN